MGAHVDGCYWAVGDSKERTYSVTLPATLTLIKAPIGSSMGAVTQQVAPLQTLRCPVSNTSQLRMKWLIDGAREVPGFPNVFETGVPGLGVKVSDTSIGELPRELTSQNYPVSANRFFNTLRFQFIRTHRDLATGTAQIDFSLRAQLNDWDAGTVRITGATQLNVPEYFSGCSGNRNITVALDKIGRTEIESTPARAFNLDVLCTGVTAGTRLPVKVYFEGNFSGAGRLRLAPGGAKGVELFLTDELGKPLPFSRSSAMNMNWMHTEANGEFYSLPVRAKYARTGSGEIEPGRADATLNYILEYN